MKVIICAAGGLDGRWTYEGREYLRTPKHLLRLADDEPTLYRTVRQLRERGITDIIITAPEGDPRYQVEGARSVHLDVDPNPAGLTLICGTRPLWADDDRTAIMFGDCWYSDAAIDAIVAVDDPEPHYVRRLGPSRVTGHSWDEPFALVIPADRHDRVLDVAQRLIDEWTGPKRLHMWQHFCALWGLHPSRKDRPHPHQTNVDDFTDDIDKPEEFRKWTGRYHAGADGVVVLMPWRDGGCPWRRRAHDFTRGRYRGYGVEVFEAPGPDGPFNRSAAINEAARRAGDWEVAIIGDTDTFVEADQMWAAAHRARTSGQAVLAFYDWVKLAHYPSRKITAGRRFPIARTARRVHGHVSSALAVPRPLWDEIGGFDERFVGWGAEDRAFWYSAITLFGEHDRIHGDAVHLWHPVSPEVRKTNPLYIANRELGQRYKRAAGRTAPEGTLLHDPGGHVGQPDRDAILSILSEPGGPLATEEAA